MAQASHALEPNPFEQSFCSKPSTSSSPVDSLLSAGGPSTSATSISSSRTKDGLSNGLTATEDSSPNLERESPRIRVEGKVGMVDGKVTSPLSGERSVRNSVGAGAGRGIENNGNSSSPGSKNLNGGMVSSITTPKPLLPGVASMASPGSVGGSGWNASLASSLRTGPLSPAMLAGPYSAGGGHHHSSSGGSFEISSFRTGFTPDLSNYRTGLTPLGSSSSNLPPPSPSTAALIALMNSQSGSSSPLGGVTSAMTPNTLAALSSHHSNHHSGLFSPQSNSHSHSHYGRDHSGAFDLAFGRSLSDKKVSRLRTSSGREKEDDELKNASAENDSLINTNGEEEKIVKVEEDDSGMQIDGNKSNERSRRESGEKTARPSTSNAPINHFDRSRTDTESSDGLHLLHQAAQDGRTYPINSHYQGQQHPNSNPQQQQHQYQQHSQNLPTMPPQTGQIVPSSAPKSSYTNSSNHRAPLTNGSSSNANSNQIPNKRRADYDSINNDSSSIQNGVPFSSFSNSQSKKARISGNRSQSTEKEEFMNGISPNQSGRASAAPSDSDTIELDELGEGKTATKGKKKAESKEGNGPESEEAKRKEFLERNRQAALKCRQRKKAWVQDLQTRNNELEAENESLQRTLSSMQHEMDSLRMQLMSRSNNSNDRSPNSMQEDAPALSEGRRGETVSNLGGNMATGLENHSYRSMESSSHNNGYNHPSSSTTTTHSSSFQDVKNSHPQQQQHPHQQPHQQQQRHASIPPQDHHQQQQQQRHASIPPQGISASLVNHQAQLPRR